MLDGDLLVCSQNAISLYSGSGTQYVSQPVSLENPVVDTNGSLAVVYDAGGSRLYVLGQRALIWSDSGLDGILSARLNRSGMLTVVTQASGYRGVVTVYNSAYEAVASIQPVSYTHLPAHYPPANAGAWSPGPAGRGRRGRWRWSPPH